MTWRFRRTKTLLPRVRLNVGKRGLQRAARVARAWLHDRHHRPARDRGLAGTGLTVTHKFADRRVADRAPVLDAISLLVFIMLLVALVGWLFR